MLLLLYFFLREFEFFFLDEFLSAQAFPPALCLPLALDPTSILLLISWIGEKCVLVVKMVF